MREMVLKFLATRAKLKKKGKTYKLSNHQGLTVVLLLFFLVEPLLATIGVLRIVDPSQRIGLNVAYTVIWIIFLAGLNLSIHKYVTTIATALLHAEQRTNEHISRGRWFGRCLYFFASISGFFAVPVLVTQGQSKETSRVCAACFLAYTGAYMLVTGIWVRWVRVQMLKVFSNKSEHQVLRNRMDHMLSGGMRLCLLSGGTLVVIASIPIMWSVSCLNALHTQTD